MAILSLLFQHYTQQKWTEMDYKAQPQASILEEV
jgi:hypothetical protein